MDYNLPVTLLALFIFLYCLIKWKNSTSDKSTPPQPSGSWPIIGHLHLLGSLPHKSLAKLADEYGSIFMIKLGVNRVLVVSSPAMAKECLSNNDRVFVNRPQTVFVEHLAYNSAMLGFSPYGPYWRQMRRITTTELLSNHRLESFRHVRMLELRSAVKSIYDSQSEPVDMKRWFNDLSLNTIVRLVAGKSLQEFYPSGSVEFNRMGDAIRAFFELAGAFVPADVLPFLRWFDIGGYEKAMIKAAKEIDFVAEEWLEEHRKRADGQKKQDFMDVMLHLFQNGQETSSEFEVDRIIKTTSMAMIIAATDTSAVSLTWGLSLLLNNKEALNKIQAELDNNVGKERRVDESDLKKLVYLQAVIKETLRLYPPVPLSVPREAVTDCTVNGYHISAGTQLFVNVYKLQRDPDVWENPCEFRPERFLTSHKDIDVRGQNFECLPFGSGRRMCPGVSFALKFMEFALANLLQAFDISTPMDQPVDMTEGFGLTNLKATPLDVIFTPRLPAHLYDPTII